jgi:hypothetical protein
VVVKVGLGMVREDDRGVLVALCCFRDGEEAWYRLKMFPRKQSIVAVVVVLVLVAVGLVAVLVPRIRAFSKLVNISQV